MTNLLKAHSSHLLVIDVQEKLLPQIEIADELVGRCRRLIEIARHLDIGITLSEHYKKGLGETPFTIRELIKDGEVFEKIHFSCLGDERLKKRFQDLEQEGVLQITICGLEAHICVFQTAIELKMAGFDVFVVADCVSARSKLSLERAWRRLELNNIAVIDSEMAIFEWLGKAGTAEFKRILPYLK